LLKESPDDRTVLLGGAVLERVSGTVCIHQMERLGVRAILGDQIGLEGGPDRVPPPVHVLEVADTAEAAERRGIRVDVAGEHDSQLVLAGPRADVPRNDVPRGDLAQALDGRL
jgi:hypothetical protein